MKSSLLAGQLASSMAGGSNIMHNMIMASSYDNDEARSYYAAA
jgi:hypothetical protein